MVSSSGSSQRSRPSRGLSSEQLDALFSAKSGLWRTLDMSAVMQASIEAATQSTGLDTGAIYLLEENVLYLGAATPALPPDFPDPLRFASAMDHPHIMRAIDTESPVLVEDLALVELTPAEAEIVSVRDLRTIIYVPLFANDRPIGVFMVASVGAPRTVGPRELDVSQTLAHSIATALEEADLFDTLMARAATRGDDLRDRLTALAAAASIPQHSDLRSLVDEVYERITRRVTLLEIRDELLEDEVTARDTAAASHARPAITRLTYSKDDLADALEESRAFARDSTTSHALEFGLGPALEYLALRTGIGPEARRITINDDAQMTDPDTTLLLYRAAKDLLEEFAGAPGARATAIRLVVDERDRVRLEIDVMGLGGSLHSSAGEFSHAEPLSALGERLRRAGGDLSLRRFPDGGTTAIVTLPHFVYAL